MNRKWFIHCLSVVLFFIERSVIFGNHIVEQRNKQEKNMSEKLKTFVGQMCNEMSILPTMVHSCANDATIFPPLFFPFVRHRCSDFGCCFSCKSN